MSPQYGELRSTSGWDRFISLGHPRYFQRLLCLGSITARQSSSERQPNFAALNSRCHLCLAGRTSRWALAHILVLKRQVADCQEKKTKSEALYNAFQLARHRQKCPFLWGHLRPHVMHVPLTHPTQNSKLTFVPLGILASTEWASWN